MNISEETITKFVEENLNDKSFSEFAESDDLKEFVAEIKQGNDIKAAEIYCKTRNASIAEARIVVKMTKNLL